MDGTEYRYNMIWLRLLAMYVLLYYTIHAYKYARNHTHKNCKAILIATDVTVFKGMSKKKITKPDLGGLDRICRKSERKLWF